MNERSASKRNTPLFWSGLLLLAGLSAYANSLRTPFLFDDVKCIKNREIVHRLWPIAPLLRESRRPLLLLSLAANHAAGGLDPLGYHVVNVGIHVLTAIVLMLLVRAVAATRPVPTASSRDASWFSFSVALLWLVHPLQTESVTYTIQRGESAMSLFYLLCLYCLTRSSRSRTPVRWLVGAVLAFYSGLGFKEVILTAPIVGLLLGRTCLFESWRETWRRQRAFVLGATPAIAWLGWRVLQTLDPHSPRRIGFAHDGVSWWEYLRTQPGVVLHYLRLAFWPDRLCLDYAWPVATTWKDVLLPGVMLTCLLLVTAILLARRPSLGFPAAAFFLVLAPTSSFFPITDLAFEHRMYLPLASISVLVVTLLATVTHRIPHESVRSFLRVGTVACLAFPLLALSVDRNRDYSSQLTMWRDVTEKAPHNARAHYNLGLQLDACGRTDEAIESYQRTLCLAPNEFRADFNLAGIHHRRRDYPAAIEHYKRAIAKKPHYHHAHNNLASIYADTGRYEAAGEHYRRAIEIQPDDARLHDNLGNLHARRERYEEAISAYRRAIEFDRLYWPAHWHLGVAYYARGDYARSAASLRTAYDLQPEQIPAARLLAHILATADDDTLRDGHQAIRLARRVARQSGYNGIRSLAVLAEAQAESGRFPEAVATARTAHEKATSAGRGADARYIRRQLELYRKNLPYRMRDGVDDVF